MKDQNEPEFIARYREYDYKPQCLWQHLQGVSNRAGKYSNKIGLGAAGHLIGLMHDLGKATTEFQEYLKYAVKLIDRLSFDLKGSKLDHSTAGAQVLYEAFLRDNSVPSLASDILALTVASHHGFMDALTPRGKDSLAKRLSKDDSETRKKRALSSLPPNFCRALQTLLRSEIDEEIAGFLREAMDENYGETERHFTVGLLVRFLLGCLIDADRIDSADFESPSHSGSRQGGHYVGWSELIRRFEKHLRGFEIRNSIDVLRQDISEKCLAIAKQEPGVFRLTVPTGGGKTLASLRFAFHHAEKHKLDRIIYVIPYTSIIDQNARSIREALEVDFRDTNIVLEHHSNLTPNKQGQTNDDEDTRAYANYKLLAENWDSPIILTTMVQFMETLYGPGTNSCRRMHQLAKSVIIFDEIQTLPVNLVHLFNLAIKFLVRSCGTTVMLCTATQPLLHDLKIPARSLPFDEKREITVTKEQKRHARERVEVVDYTRPQGWNHTEISELAFAEFNWDKSVLVIVNTKRDAANIFLHLRKQGDIPVYHLSTNMCPAHRIEKLSETITLLDRGKPLILVSTQLIEAGVDVDFDVVIRSLAGIDSIAQAAGRCNRHGEKIQQGRVILVNSNEENLTKLPDIAIAKKNTERILEEFRRDKDGYFQKHLLSDPTLERYFQYYFRERSSEMDYPVDQRSLASRSDTLVDMLSANRKSVSAYKLMHQNQLPYRILKQSFQTASKCFQVISNIGQGVIIPYGEGKKLIAELSGAFEPKKQFETLRQAQRVSVNCFTHELEHLAQENALHEVQKGSSILYLDETFYHEELGLTLYKSSEMSIYQV